MVRHDAALRVFNIRPMGIEEALRQTLANEDRQFATTRWSDALSSSGEVPSWCGVRFGTRLVDSRTAKVSTRPEVAFTPIQRIGGNTGWYAWNSLWKLRGFLDLLAGGVGMRRGRPTAETIRAGDSSSSTIRQTAIFDPVGLFGLAYWYALYPVHQLVFGGMLRRIVDAAYLSSSSNRDFSFVYPGGTSKADAGKEPL